VRGRAGGATVTTETVRTADAVRVQAALRGCAEESIRVPGSVQPHGVLLAVHEPSLEVACVSAHAAALLGRSSPEDLLGEPLGDLLGEAGRSAVEAGRQDLEGGATTSAPRVVVLPGAGGRALDLLLHRSDGLLVAELEPAAAADEAPWWQLLPRTLQRLQGARSVEQLAALLAPEVRAVTGFDRVMVYRFSPEWHGEVVAEARDESLEPFLGLHYPASDIPPQARELYLHNWLRLFPDVDYTPVPLVPPVLPAVDGGPPRPLDLGGAVLRSVSPAHVEYLRAMGVRASMSVSLIVGGRLWGLLACHHYAGPHRPDARARSAAEFLGRTASVLLETQRDGGEAALVLATSAAQAALTRALADAPRAPLDALTATPGLLDLVPAGGAAVRLAGELRLVGETPGAHVVPAVTAALWPGPQRETVVTRSLPTLLGGEAAARGLGLDPRVASGLLAVPVGGGDGRDFLAWFRPEVLRDVAWGGDPYATRVVDDSSGLRLGPRHSFHRWTETVRLTATAWRRHEVEAAQRLARHVADTVLRRAEEEARLVSVLQRTVLGEPPSPVPGIALAARYAPSQRDVVGGDWYDVLLLPGGRVAVVVGDVAGHGMGVAALSAQLRLGLRAHLLNTPSPAAALRRLNELVAWQLPGDLATAVVAVLDPATGLGHVASAGHLPAVLLSGGEALLLETERGPALGVLEDVAYGETELHLPPGDGLLLYSDGLVERRETGIDERLQWLVGHAAGGGEPDEVCDRLLAAMPPTTDDVTLLVVARDPSGAPTRG
jgi:chemotaxis family two-component system sensor kinase Cph1